MVSALSCAAFASRAEAYEFEIKSRTLGQSARLEALRLSGPSVYLTRRRVTQSLQLHLWDLMGTRAGLSAFDPKPIKGPKLYFSSYLRLDQDYGSYTAGEILLGGDLRDALDVVPELGRSALNLELLYGYAAAEGLADGRVDVFVGRQMEVQTLDWFSIDGLKVRLHLPMSLALEAFGGLRVRDSSWLGSATMEPDGSSGALCEEYVEGVIPGTGAWRPIDGLPEYGRSPFTSDDEFCPQRQELMPTWGAALSTDGLGPVIARVSYRRSQSRSPGLLGESDRLDTEDVGFYPNEMGQAPAWGVNEERIAASVRVPLRPQKTLQLVPYAALRYSLLHGLVDEAHTGLRVAKAAHSLETEFFYSVPTFDGDSIFNIFSTEPYTDARATWEFQPRDARLGGYLRGWGRRYHSGDKEAAAEPEELDTNEYAAGVHLGMQYRLQRARVARLDAFHENGYGGLRTGSYLSTRWSWRRSALFTSRISVIRFDEDLRANLKGYNLGAQLGATYIFGEGVAASLLVEENSNRFDRFQLGVFAMIDLAFQPET